MEEGKLFKGSFFGFSKKDVLNFLEELNKEQKLVNDKKEKDLTKLTKAVSELVSETERLQNENNRLSGELSSSKNGNVTASTPPNTDKVENKSVSAIEDDLYIDDCDGITEEFADKMREKTFDPKNSDLYCEMLKEIETLRQEKDEMKRQFEEAICEIRESYEKKLMDKNDEIYARRQKYFNAVLEHIQYKRNAEKKLHELSKEN